MKFEQKALIAAPKDRVWAFLMDVPVMAQCIPGVTSVEPLGDDQYRGTLKVRVGPISLSLQGDVTIVTRDEAAGIATMTAEAADKRVGGAVKASMQMVLAESTGATSATELHVTTDAQVMGRLGEFGQSMIRKRADSIMQEFAENLRRKLEVGQQEASV